MKNKWLIIGVVVAVVVAVIIWRKKNSGNSNNTDTSKGRTTDEIIADYKEKLEGDNDREQKFQEIKTATDRDYLAWAQDLIAAMKGLGTNERVIFEIFKNKIKSYADCEALVEAVASISDTPLAMWLRNELNKKERNKLNTLLRERNINYRFF